MNYTKSQSLALLFLRLVLAAIFIVAGYMKFTFWSTTMPGMSSFMTNMMKFLSIAEPLGGLALLLGFLSRPAAACLSIIMLGAIYEIQFTLHMGFVTQTGAGWNFPAAILAGLIIVLAFGPGAFSVEAARKR